MIHWAAVPKGTVLIIANPLEAMMVRRALEEAGVASAIAEGGEGAVAKYDEERPSAVVLAHDVYTGDAAEVLGAIRSRPGARVPVLLISEAAWPDCDLDAEELVRRPIDGRGLLARIDELCGEPLPRTLVAEPEVLRADEAIAGPLVAPPVEPIAPEPEPEPEMELEAEIEMEAEPEPELPVDDRAIVDEANLVAGESVVDEVNFVAGDSIVDETNFVARDSIVEERAVIARPDERANGVGGLGRIGLDSLPGIDAELGLAPPHANGLGSGDTAGDTIRELPDFGAGEGLRGEGDLAVESVPELLARLHRGGFTGRLALRHGEAEKSVWFDAGFVVNATSTLAHDGLVELLFREGKLTREQAGRARPGASRRSLVEALVETRALKREEVFAALRHHVEELVYSCFVWERGSFRLERETVARDDVLGLPHPYALALEGIRRKYGLERLVERVGPPSTELSATPSTLRSLPDAGLTVGERAAALLLRRGSATVAELQSEGRLDRAGAYALAWGLLAIGAASREVAAPADEAGSASLVDRERALAKHEQVRDGDYFAILGVDRDATPYEIRRAWERMRFEFAPDRVDPSVRLELGAQLDEIVEVVDEAFGALSDDRLRASYRAHLE